MRPKAREAFIPATTLCDADRKSEEVGPRSVAEGLEGGVDGLKGVVAGSKAASPELPGRGLIADLEGSKEEGPGFTAGREGLNAGIAGSKVPSASPSFEASPPNALIALIAVTACRIGRALFKGLTEEEDESKPGGSVATAGRKLS
mmetsp:Transcript_29290/g.57345  ORF Transcript_29290/g.57345 Transcript_29290/m.57345 type:complete len:146 (-) Transcript_29290:31-468(-)